MAPASMGKPVANERHCQVVADGMLPQSIVPATAVHIPNSLSLLSLHPLLGYQFDYFSWTASWGRIPSDLERFAKTWGILLRKMGPVAHRRVRHGGGAAPRFGTRGFAARWGHELHGERPAFGWRRRVHLRHRRHCGGFPGGASGCCHWRRR